MDLMFNNNMEYDNGVDAFLDGKPYDPTASRQWRMGWLDAQDRQNEEDDYGHQY